MAVAVITSEHGRQIGQYRSRTSNELPEACIPTAPEPPYNPVQNQCREAKTQGLMQINQIAPLLPGVPEPTNYSYCSPVKYSNTGIPDFGHLICSSWLRIDIKK